MMFDNSPPATPTTWTRVKQHLPIAALLSTAVAVVVGIHMASAALAIAAAGHLVVAGMVVAVRSHRSRPAEDAVR